MKEKYLGSGCLRLAWMGKNNVLVGRITKKEYFEWNRFIISFYQKEMLKFSRCSRIQVKFLLVEFSKSNQMIWNVN